MICKVCDVNNSEDSKFCVECGASFGKNNGKYTLDQIKKAVEEKDPHNFVISKGIEKKRVVSAEEMKQLLWSIDWEKIRNSSEKKRLIDQIQNMMKIWKNDPSYIPIIMAPTKNNKILTVQEMKKSGVNPINTTKIDTCGCIEQVFVYNHRSPIPKSCAVCLWQNPEHPDNELNEQIDKVDNALKLQNLGFDIELDDNEEFRIKKCGVCGTIACQKEHIPPIQLQYQEAFENIQCIWELRKERLRREHWNNKPFPMHELRKGLDGGKGKQRPTSTIIERDVRKGIGGRKPKRPFKSISIRKGLDRKKKKPRFPKFKPDNPRILKKGWFPRRRAIHPEKVEY